MNVIGGTEEAGPVPSWTMLGYLPEWRSPTRVASVDVEDYYHAAALEPAISRTTWPTLESRVHASTTRTLALFRRNKVKGTFFVLGAVASAHPDLARAIVSEGHEVASHGFDHYRVGHQTPASFFADVRRAKDTLEDITGCEVIGYRAPNFSINRETWWAYDELARAGYRYSSSVYPLRHDHYGMPDAPTEPFQVASGVVEFPITVAKLFGRNLPAGGGGYFRLLPYIYWRWAIRHASAEHPGIINYFHPWEIDAGQPRHRLPWLSAFRHYVNLHRMEGKLDRLFRDLDWGRFDECYRALRTEPGDRVQPRTVQSKVSLGKESPPSLSRGANCSSLEI